jgi:hypothetical protein
MRGESAANERSTDNHKIMKSDSTPSQSGPSSPPFLTGPPRAQLESLLDLAQEHAEDAMREDGALSPALFVASPEGLFLLGSGPWEDPQQKDDFVANARLLCAAHAASAVVLAYETSGGRGRAGRAPAPGRAALGVAPAQRVHRALRRGRRRPLPAAVGAHHPGRAGAFFVPGSRRRAARRTGRGPPDAPAAGGPAHTGGPRPRKLHAQGPRPELRWMPPRSYARMTSLTTDFAAVNKPHAPFGLEELRQTESISSKSRWPVAAS